MSSNPPNLPPDLMAKIALRLNRTQVTSNNPTGKATFMNKSVQHEIESLKKHPELFPAAGVSAAMKALDIIAPENYEERITTITRLYLEGAGPAIISEQTGIHIDAVKAELARIDTMRKVTLKENPKLGEKIVDEHFELITRSQNMIEQLVEVIAEVRENITMDLELRRADPKNYKAGIRALHLNALAQLMEAIGGHQDRIGQTLGVLKARDNVTIQNNLVNVTFTSDVLNKTVDDLLKAAGQIPVTILREEDKPAAQRTIDVTPQKGP